jgi:PadR family transcriptional regulator PadR
MPRLTARLCSNTIQGVRRLSITTTSVLHAIGNGYEYGFDVIDATGLPSGTVYPALSRLERDGYVRSAWEDEAAAHGEGRPARRYYRLTAAGVRALGEALKYYRSLLPQAGHPAPAGKGRS